MNHVGTTTYVLFKFRLQLLKSMGRSRCSHRYAPLKPSATLLQLTWQNAVWQALPLCKMKTGNSAAPAGGERERDVMAATWAASQLTEAQLRLRAY